RRHVVPSQSQALRTLARSRPEGEATPAPPGGSPARSAPALRDVLRRQRARRAAYEGLIGTPPCAAAGLVERPDRGPERQAHDVAPASLDGLHRPQPIVLNAVGPRLVEPGAGRHVGIDLRTIVGAHANRAASDDGTCAGVSSEGQPGDDLVRAPTQ